MARKSKEAQDETNAEREDTGEDQGENSPQNKIREQIVQRAKAIDIHYVALGHDLYHVAQRKLYRDWGFATFVDFIEVEVGIGKRRGQRLVQIWKRLVRDFKVDPGDLSGARYSNLLLIMSLDRPKILTKETVGEWIARAKTLTYKKLSEMIDEKLKAAGFRPTEEGTSIPDEAIEDDSENEKKPKATGKKSFAFTSEEEKVVDEAIREATSEKGSDRPGNALANICTFFLANKAEDTSMKQFLLDRLSSVFGGRFVHLETTEMITAWDEAFSEIDDEGFSEEEDGEEA